MSIIKTFKKGQHYLKTWPKINRLGSIFPENRVIKVTVFAQKFMPFIAVFSIVWQQIYSPANIISLAIAIITAIFALGLPLQGLYWLGKRAESKLPTQSAVSFYKISQKLKDKNVITVIVEEPTYQHLADILQKAEKNFSTEFWEDL